MVDRKYLRGVLWFLLSLLLCQCNDSIMKLLSVRIAPIQTTFLRFALATLLLLPFMIFMGNGSLSTKMPQVHFLRSLFLFGAIVCWCHGLRRATMPMAVVVGFAMPLFLLIFAWIFLGERISKLRWAATAVGFLGIIIVAEPQGSHFNWAMVPLLLSTVFFAALDILNRRCAREETMWSMLFYAFLGTTIVAAIPALYLWKPMGVGEWFWSIALGIGANLLYFCVVRALRLIEASATAPYRYVEFLFSLFTGYLFFGEVANGATLVGAAIIVPVTLLLAIHESRSSCEKDLKHYHSCC